MRFLKIIILIPLIIFIISCQKTEPILDLVILNGRIIDGTGNPWYFANVGLKDGKIVKIGKLNSAFAKKTIDANGLIVSPGFIDVHTHADRKIASETDAMNYIRQGVTTIVGGNCGGSQFPLKDLYTDLENKGIAINFASLVGHNTIRRKVMGRDDRAPESDELEQMKKLVRQEMLAGAIGLSTGLAYVPGRYSETEEIVELAKMIQPFNGIYATHIRNQGKKIKEAIEEAVRIGREAGVPVQISHIKLAVESVWGKYHLITGPIEKSRQEGLEIYMDQYPYTATSSGFNSSFPGWAVAGGTAAFGERLKSPENYDKIKTAIIRKRLTSEKGIDRLKSIYVSKNKNHSEYEGKNLAEILDILGKKKTISNGADLIIEMQKTDSPRGIFFQMAEEDVSKLMSKSYNMIASDGKIEIPGVEVPHPRAYGTFPRVLAKYVRELTDLSLSDAIRKMTSLPAQSMGFYSRGILREGMCADIVAFDVDKIKDNATFNNPHQYPDGIPWVIVNGKLVIENNNRTNNYPGKILYGSGKN